MNIQLSNEQQLAYEKYIQGNNLFITGPGGSGKSELIKKIFDNAKKTKKKIQVCALTGRAALLLNCEARTLHSWSGIGLGKGSIDQMIKKIFANKRSLKNWRSTSILVIDEVSMLSYKLFEMLNKIGKVVRGVNHLPFGGIQVIFTGDFFQLPPVGDKEDIDSGRFCFESEEWNEIFNIKCQIQLKKIFRQSDEEYATILNQIREGKITRKSCNKLYEYVGRSLQEGAIKPTKLLPTRIQAESINNYEMSLISDVESFQYQLKYCKILPMTEEEKEIRKLFTDIDIDYELKYMHDNMMCDDIVNLKIGASVMCIINIPCSDDTPMLCNGSQGVVVRISHLGNPIVKFINGYEREMTPNVWLSEKIPGIGISQIPLILAWAITIHKSQGATLESAEIDAGKGIFECGQTYVALSRVKSLDGLYLTSFDPSRILVNKKVKEFYRKLKELESNLEVNSDSTLEQSRSETSTNIFINFQNVSTITENQKKEYEDSDKIAQ